MHTAWGSGQPLQVQLGWGVRPSSCGLGAPAQGLGCAWGLVAGSWMLLMDLGLGALGLGLKTLGWAWGLGLGALGLAMLGAWRRA